MILETKYTDQEIIQFILEGKTELYELLVRRNNPYLYKVGRAYGFNHHDTEDLMQETYISAYFNLGKFENRAQFKTWIIRIMLNNCFGKKNKSYYTREILDEKKQQNLASMEHSSNSSKTLINKELGHIMENALSEIPEDYRVVFALRELSGLSTLETAEAISISEANVKVRLNRAKAMMRNKIEKMYTAEDIYEFNLVYCDAMVDKVMRGINTIKP